MPAVSKAQYRKAWANKRKSWARKLIAHTSRQTLKNLPERVTRTSKSRRLAGRRTSFKRRRRSGRRQRRPSR